VSHDEAKRRILMRRARLVAAAVAGLGAAVACGGQVTPQPCLEPVQDGGPDATQPQPCLGVALDSGPQPCLTPIQDSGPGDAGTD
jgi:hypothetical protein